MKLVELLPCIVKKVWCILVINKNGNPFASFKKESVALLFLSFASKALAT